MFVGVCVCGGGGGGWGVKHASDQCICSCIVLFSFLYNDLQVASVGPQLDLTYEHENLGDEVQVLEALADGSHPFCKVRGSE